MVQLLQKTHKGRTALLTVCFCAALLSIYSQKAFSKENKLNKRKYTEKSFIENKGQIIDQWQQARPDIDFKIAAAEGLNIFIGPNGLHYQWAAAGQKSVLAGIIPDFGSMQNEHDTLVNALSLYRMDVKLLGANSKPCFVKGAKNAYYERYFQPWLNKGNDNAGITVHSFDKITYKDVYPGIDWTFYFNDAGQLEYDFVVHPGGKVSDIRIEYAGATQLALNQDGSLTAVTPMGKVKENKPYSYIPKEDITAQQLPLSAARNINPAMRKEVASGFTLQGNVLSFQVNAYTGTLVIDPVLEWGSYFGSIFADMGNAVTTDKRGNVYLGGQTMQGSNMATTGAHQVSYAGGSEDAFLNKWTQQGRLLWSTYYGGSKVERARGLVCDEDGNVYMGGPTNSPDGISTAGSHQSTFGNGSYDAFLVKFDSAGQRIWGTYYGGTASSSNEANTSFDMAIDRANNIYLTGNTQSINLQVTTGAHQSQHGGSNDAFIAKFSPTGLLSWSTYYGGSAHDYGTGIAVDTAGHVYVTGYTQSTNNMATATAHQPNSGGGQDAFLVKLDSSGKRIWATFLGGSAIDRGSRVVALSDRVILGGLTYSTSGVATTNSHQPSFAGGLGGDALIACFSTEGTLLWSTYYGGTLAETFEGIWANAYNEFYITGQTFSESGIATKGSYKDSLDNEAGDLFFSKFSADGQLLWGSYFGGKGADVPRHMAGSGHDIYLTGFSSSLEGIATANAHQQTIADGGEYNDAILVHFFDCPVPSGTDTIIGPRSVCAGLTYNYFLPFDPKATQYEWILPEGWSGQSRTNDIRLTTGARGGLIQIVKKNDCNAQSDTLSLQVDILPSPIPEIEVEDKLLSTKDNHRSYQWMLDGQDIAGATKRLYTALQDGQYAVRVTNGDSCTGTSATVEIKTLGIAGNIAEAGINLYPNPSNGLLYIESAYDAQAVLYSITGQSIIDHIVIRKGIRQQIDIRPVAKGTYLLQVQSAGTRMIQKITIE